MQRILIALGCATAIVCTAFFKDGRYDKTPSNRIGSAIARAAETANLTDDHPRPPGDCVAGCSIANHPIESLTESEYLDLVEKFANGTGPSGVDALETLLFHATDTRAFIEQSGTSGLAGEKKTLLERELAKTHVRLWLRLVDDDGVVRAKIDGERFPIGERTHLRVASTENLPAPEISGTVHRTGLHHLWTRM